MGICCGLGCNNHSDRGPEFCRHLCPNRERKHIVSLFRIPAIVHDEGKMVLELTTRRRDGFLAEISGEEMDMNNLRICSNHFISGEPSNLMECILASYD